jgi:hypothetical protein
LIEIFLEYCNNEFRRIIKEKERGSQRIFYPVPSHYYPPTADGDKLYYGLLKILGYIKKTYEPYMHKISMSRVDYIHGIDEIEKKYQTEETWKLVPQARIAHEEMIKVLTCKNSNYLGNFWIQRICNEKVKRCNRNRKGYIGFGNIRC